MMDSNDLQEIYDKFWEVSGEMLATHSPAAVAGVMAAQAMTIYKTILTPEEFERMAESIYNSRGQVRKIEGPVIQ